MALAAQDAGHSEDSVHDTGAHLGLVIVVSNALAFPSPRVLDIMISGKTRVIAHLGFPTEAFKAPMIYNPWFEKRGIDAVVVPRDHSAKLTATAVKTSTGAAETVPVFRAPNLARCLSWLKEAGVWVVGADAEAPKSLYQTKLEPPVAMVLGGEGRGVRRLTRDLCDELVYIPMAGSVESLNVSVATGIELIELLRQAPK